MSIIGAVFAAMILFLAWGFITETTLSKPRTLMLLSLGICTLSAMDIALMEAAPLMPARLLTALGDNPEYLAIVKAFLDVVLVTISGGMVFMAFTQRAKQLHVEGIAQLQASLKSDEKSYGRDSAFLKKLERDEDAEDHAARLLLAVSLAELEEEIEAKKREVARRQCYN